MTPEPVISNEPVSVEAGGPVGRGASAETFDTMEAIVEQTVAAKKEEKSQKEKPAAKDPPAEKEEPVTEEDGETKETETEEPADEPKEKPAEDDGAVLAPSTPAKMIRLEVGGKEIELPEDVEIPHRVDGNPVKVTLKELKSHYAGKVVWERRYNELSADKKRHDDHVATINQRVDGILQLSQTDPMAAFLDICRMSGKKPEEMTKAWKGFSDEAARWMSLSEVEQEAELAKQERDFYKRSHEETEKSQVARQAQAQLETEARQIKEQFHFSDEEWSGGLEKAASIYDRKTLTPRHVACAIRLTQAEAVLKEVAPDHLKDGDPAFGLLYKAAVENPDFTREDLKDIAEKTYGSDSARRLAAKVKPKTPPRQQSSKREPVSFEDL